MSFVTVVQPTGGTSNISGAKRRLELHLGIDSTAATTNNIKVVSYIVILLTTQKVEWRKRSQEITTI